MDWMLLPLKRYAQFSGRSRRKEYWMFTLLNVLIYVFLTILQIVIGGGMAAMTQPGMSDPAAGAGLAAVGVVGILQILVSLAFLIPSIAVGVRRLHDTNRSGWWYLLPVIPYVLGFGLLSYGLISSIGGGDSNGGPALAIVGGLLLFVGFICAITVLVFFCLDGTRGPNRFGADPKGSGDQLDEVFR